MYPPFSHAKLIKKIAHHAAGDLQNTFLSWPMLVMIGGTLASSGTLHLDNDFHFEDDNHLGKFNSVANVAFKPYVADPFALALWGLGKATHHKKLALTGETLFETLLFTDVMTGGLKLAFHRERPNGGTYSFPSGHAATSFAMATVLQNMYGWKAGVPAYAVASLVSYSRLDSNAHHFTDVLFGATLGIAIGWGTSHFHKMENKNFWVLPQTGSTMGINVVYQF